MLDFSWSKSRAATFEECRRKYYLNYYAYHGGWFSDATPLARQAYILRSLDTIPSWVGRLVHESLAHTLRELRAAHDTQPVDLGRMLARLRKRMTAEFEFSAERRYWYTSKRNADGQWRALFEHEYNQPIRRDEADYAFVQAASALAGFMSLPMWHSLIHETNRDDWLAIDTPTIITIDGARIWSVPDLVYTTVDGVVTVVDWKTGQPKPSHASQLIPYAAGVSLKHNIPFESIILAPTYPTAYTEFKASKSHLSLWADDARKSIADMRALLCDDGTPQPIDAFPQTPDVQVCGRCNFHSICYPETRHATTSKLPIVSTAPHGMQ